MDDRVKIIPLNEIDEIFKTVYDLEVVANEINASTVTENFPTLSKLVRNSAKRIKDILNGEVKIKEVKGLNQWAKEFNELANEKGFWDKDRDDLICHALFHSEISEATEEVRNNKPHFYQELNAEKIDKPQGQAVELADALIRILEFFHAKGWNVEEVIEAKHLYNKTRSYMHGGKKY